MLRGLDLRNFPEHIENAIVTPHEHEMEGSPPLWIIWKIEKSRGGGPQEFPAIDSICDSERSARYHVAALLEASQSEYRGVDTLIFVERVPANHRFGSSLADVFFTESMQAATSIAAFRNRYKYPRDGD